MNKRKTILARPYGRIPIQDAKADAPVSVQPVHIRNGKRNNPAGCAQALAINDTPEGIFPGDYLAARVNKTHTVIIATINNRVQARRYMHDEATRSAINGFDAQSCNAFPSEGIVITLRAPKGMRKSGTRKSPTPGPIKEPRTGTPRVSRSVYRYHIDKVAADRVR